MGPGQMPGALCLCGMGRGWVRIYAALASCAS